MAQLINGASESTEMKPGGDQNEKILFGASKPASLPAYGSTRMVQNVLLIWLDKNINLGKSKDNQNTMRSLRGVVNTIETFTDGEKCIEFIKTVQNNDKICIIVSGSYGETIVPPIHSMPQVDSIFVFCNNKSFHEGWARNWKKINGVFTNIERICEALKRATQQCEHNAVSISLLAADDGAANKKLDKLECSFMYTLILKEILLTINFEGKHVKNFIHTCRKDYDGNDRELKNIKKFEKDYRKKTPIWWYTLECFMYARLNRALRLMEVDDIIDMGFFINDLHRQIAELNQKQFRAIQDCKMLTLYRGQGISIAEFERMKKAQGGLLSFNSFLSTSRNRSAGLEFSIKNLRNPDLIGILFVMTVIPSQSKTAFADIKDISYVQKEDEVLFSMHTVFRIGNIKPLDDEQRLFEVDLLLTADNDKDFRALTTRLRQEIAPVKEGWDRLGFLLLKMGQHDRAEKVYEVLLAQTTNDIEKSNLNVGLGNVKHSQGKYNEAIRCFKNALKTYNNAFDLKYTTLSAIHNNMGCVYRKMHEYSHALASYHETLALQRQSLVSNDPALASTHNNIGNVYADMGQYTQALSAHQEALAIRQVALPPTHPDLASTYNNLGNVLYKTNQYHHARVCYDKAVSIAKSSLPSNHPDIETYLKNLYSVSNHL
ncbi:unnamed protein product [Rotaria socialis]|uniref:NAD(P)(+)--arginine ADP-ribosyltransferase n=2 Tax=Rotaria socialis TaxID=392032 RepID=A0A818BKS6_9BILA|nr:unnamed protein product [Rotaria socialis]CAF4433369.1 unnamed protein product [Rotaria socialis]